MLSVALNILGVNLREECAVLLYMIIEDSKAGVFLWEDILKVLGDPSIVRFISTRSCRNMKDESLEVDIVSRKLRVLNENVTLTTRDIVLFCADTTTFAQTNVRKVAGRLDILGVAAFRTCYTCLEYCLVDFFLNKAGFYTESSYACVAKMLLQAMDRGDFYIDGAKLVPPLSNSPTTERCLKKVINLLMGSRGCCIPEFAHSKSYRDFDELEGAFYRNACEDQRWLKVCTKAQKCGSCRRDF